MRILGIDPGSRLVGYGCIDRLGNQIRYVAHGTLQIGALSGPSALDLGGRLLLIHEMLSQVMMQLKPHIMVVEDVFFAKNALSALKLGQARGVVIVTGKIHGLKLEEYSPTQVKKAVVGHGHADKEQVAKMVQLILGQKTFGTLDASDALALAICHAQMMRSSYREGKAL